MMVAAYAWIWCAATSRYSGSNREIGPLIKRGAALMMMLETAERITTTALGMISELDALLSTLQEREPEDEFKQLRRDIMPLYADIQERLLDRTFREHPSAAPDWWPGRKAR
jgi:hypothetical protein